MHIGKDFFAWTTFIVKLIRLFIEIFGDENEKEVVKNNHINV